MTTRIGRPRDFPKEQFWRRTIADHFRSGLSIKAYCQREGLEPRAFPSVAASVGAACPRLLLASDGRSARLVHPTGRELGNFAIRAVQNAAEPTASTTPIEIVLHSGRTVRVTRGFDPQALDLVLSVLDARRC